MIALAGTAIDVASKPRSAQQRHMVSPEVISVSPTSDPDGICSWFGITPARWRRICSASRPTCSSAACRSCRPGILASRSACSSAACRSCRSGISASRSTCSSAACRLSRVGHFGFTTGLQFGGEPVVPVGQGFVAARRNACRSTSSPSSGTRRRGSSARRTACQSTSSPSSGTRRPGLVGSTQRLPVHVQPFFRHSSAGFVGSTQRLPVHVQPFFRHSSAGFVGSTQRLPSQTQPFFRHSSAGFVGSTQRLPSHVQPFFRHSSAGLVRFDATAARIALIAAFAHALAVFVAILVRTRARTAVRFSRRSGRAYRDRSRACTCTGRRRCGTRSGPARTAARLSRRTGHAHCARTRACTRTGLIVAVLVRARLALWRGAGAAAVLGNRLSVGAAIGLGDDAHAAQLAVSHVSDLADAGATFAAHLIGARLALRPLGLLAALGGNPRRCSGEVVAVTVVVARAGTGKTVAA